jgi:MOSC domain-containing protein YiiM
MMLISVNVGRPRRLRAGGRVITTAIFKEPVTGPVWVRRHNLDGDRQADRRVHGGADKAVYAYPFEHYAFWAHALGRDDLSPGFFGENLTITDLPEDEVAIGDVLRMGEAVLEVSQPRTPCYKLGIRAGSEDFPTRFAESLRCGFYLRVLAEGRVQAGEPIARVARGEGGMSVREVFRLKTDAAADTATLARAARLPALAASGPASFEKRLAQARAG